MAEQDNKSEVTKPEVKQVYVMQQWDPSLKEKEFMGDDGEWNWREKRKYKKYQKSDKAKYDQQNYEMNQKSQFYNSAYDFYKTMLARQAGAAYVKPEVVPEDKTEKVVEKPEVKPEVKPKVVTPVDPVPPVVEEVDWTEIGKQHGLYSPQQVKELQKKLGLPETGNLDNTTLERKAWYDKMKELGYTEDVAANGVVSFSNPQGYSYFNDGTTYKSGNKVSYDYKTLPKVVTTSAITSAPIKFTKEHFLNSPFFANRRLHGNKSHINYLFKNGATEYLLRKGADLDKSGNYGIKHNALYAYDEKTGKIRQVKTDILGAEQYGNGDLLWEGDWFDVSKLLEDPEQIWLTKNPRPGYSAVNNELDLWKKKYEDAKRTGFKKQGGQLINKINKNLKGGTMRTKYFQQGGAAPQQDMQQQVIALVQAAMQGDQKATETVNKIMEAAKAGDQQAMQIAQMIQQVAQQMQGQATAAKWGAKLNYIRSLKYAKGGKTCPTCNQEIEMKKCGGKKAKKKYFGGWL